MSQNTHNHTRYTTAQRNGRWYVIRVRDGSRSCNDYDTQERAEREAARLTRQEAIQ
jgi:hypothetical protein